jgi:hypothetical protein
MRRLLKPLQVASLFLAAGQLFTRQIQLINTTDEAPLQDDGSNAIPLILKNDDGNLVPTLGIIIEF